MPTQHVYFISCHRGRFVKIGISHNPKLRMSGLQNNCPYPLVFLGSRECSNPRSAEMMIHQLCAEDWVHREWFRLTSNVRRWIAEFLEEPNSFLIELDGQAQDNESHYASLRRLRKEHRDIGRWYAQGMPGYAPHQDKAS